MEEMQEVQRMGLKHTTTRKRTDKKQVTACTLINQTCKTPSSVVTRPHS